MESWCYRKKNRNKYNRREKRKEIVSFQEEEETKKKEEYLDFIHTKTIFFPYVQLETEEERTYIDEEKEKEQKKIIIN